MKVALIENNAIKYIGFIKELFPNTSFPAQIPLDFLTSNSLLEVVDTLDFDPAIQNLVQAEPFILEGKVYTCSIVEKTTEEKQSYSDSVALNMGYSIRLERNRLLANSDWTQVADAPVDKAAWAAYRQALRDITGQAGFPNDVTFPNPPL